MAKFKKYERLKDRPLRISISSIGRIIFNKALSEQFSDVDSVDIYTEHTKKNVRVKLVLYRYSDLLQIHGVKITNSKQGLKSIYVKKLADHFDIKLPQNKVDVKVYGGNIYFNLRRSND